MKIKELRNLTSQDLSQREKTLKEELFKLNQQRYGGRVEKPHMFSAIRYELALIRTVCREKEEKKNG
ncbi:MAG: 50S ribosomal protein L29 [Candidatus Omnitrophota bacterium]|jgi:large subunit ribosomal protein L29|nr:50S ribosomal protein L29 [Candidatus Omnitrophota bacterium]MDD3983002.1 50S ribosomal protein L29 [Candidatus Omnitrophota bacterium]MDD5526045.1 50S ribosomal protein L29 [Candidatus Omnitrophota bacterium]NLE91278.1 50S ribosomal protein L29 [Elusimicrobiota bacterium]